MMDSAHHVLEGEATRAETPEPAPPQDLSNARGETPTSPVDGPQLVERKQVVNKLNYLNFQNKNVTLAFEHARYGHTLRIEAQPQPCRESQVRCNWVEPHAARAIFRDYVFSSLFIPDEQKLLQGMGQVSSLDEQGIVIELPATCTEVHTRRVVRHPCNDIAVQLLQSSSSFLGALLDFSPLSFRARLSTSPPQTFGWLNASSPVTVILAKGGELCFSGDCRIVSMTNGRTSREYVLEPTQDRIQRFERKQYRCARQELIPAPTVVFEHPLTGRLVSLKALDISTSGVAVEEFSRTAVLMPGLMIPRLELCLAGNFRFPCRAQVVHRQNLHPEAGGSASIVKHGLAILDMDVADHVQLVALLHHAENRHSYVCNQVDMDELWSFFFETGFIYPQKYDFIQRNRDRIKLTYEKLYAENPSIARHFVYQDRGKILGHMSMVRFYDSTWLIHHHAARSNHSYKAGLRVLEQITRFVTESCRFAFMHMEHVVCYYRPDNRFPRTVFGGVCRAINDPHKCSEATFGYVHLTCHEAAPKPAGHGDWLPATDDDLRELSSFCQYHSAGLMIEALDLEPGDSQHSNLTDEFSKLGMKRERHVYALKTSDRLLALALLNLADIGLNLSDLTNSLTLFVVDPHDLTTQGLHDGLCTLMKHHGQNELPLLIYPETAAQSLEMPIEKRYVMWTLRPHHSDVFNRSLNGIFRADKRNGGAHDRRRPAPV